MSLLSEAFGGYIELELPTRDQPWLATALKFNSARAAFCCLLGQLNIQRVWLPRYLCDSMTDALIGRDITFNYYDLAGDFTIASEVSLGQDSLLLYVNYFGLCGPQTQEVISRYGESRVVIDNSQALFCSPFNCLATIYSPRKFFGLPDGGLLYSENPRVQQAEFRDNTSEARMGHLISRLTNSPEAAYQNYLEAEHAIANMPVLAMSRLTERLLCSVDYTAAKTARARNAWYLHERLGEYNQLALDFNDGIAPLCYPFLPMVKTASREELITNRVFVPRYWPEVLDRVEQHSFEWTLVTKGLFLPCDQRYTESDMDRLIRLLSIK